MTNLYQPNRNEGTPLIGAFAIVVLLLVIVFGFDRFSGGWVGERARGAAGAARSLLASVGDSIQENGYFASKSSLAHENESLRRELEARNVESALLDHVQSENEILQGMARLAAQEHGVTARVLSSLDNTPYGTFLIDAGFERGVREGSLVLVEGDFLVGQVTSVNASSATVEALFSPGAEHDMRAGETAFVAEGRGGGTARADVPRESLVAVGDVAIAAAFGRPAGTVLHVESASSSAIATLSIRVPVNLDTLRYVYVLTQ